MTTIFLMVLKKLIKEQLNPLSTNLSIQAKSYGYQKNLSTDQKEIIDTLDGVIQKLEGTGDDDADCKAIGVLIDAAREKIKERREHYKYNEKGNTKDTVDGLKLHISDFHKKLTTLKIEGLKSHISEHNESPALKFDLLNKAYTLTPENIVYFHAAYYFGEEIFDPKQGMDVDIRNQKERKLVSRLISLSKLIQPTDSLEEQKAQCLQTIEDIATDNKAVIKKDEKNSAVAIPGVSFWGVSLTLSKVWECFSAGEGRLQTQFDFAARKIREMTEETFEPPLIPEQEVVNEM